MASLAEGSCRCGEEFNVIVTRLPHSQYHPRDDREIKKSVLEPKPVFDCSAFCMQTVPSLKFIPSGIFNEVGSLILDGSLVNEKSDHIDCYSLRSRLMNTDVTSSNKDFSRSLSAPRVRSLKLASYPSESYYVGPQFRLFPRRTSHLRCPHRVPQRPQCAKELSRIRIPRLKSQDICFHPRSLPPCSDPSQDSTSSLLDSHSVDPCSPPLLHQTRRLKDSHLLLNSQSHRKPAQVPEYTKRQDEHAFESSVRTFDRMNRALNEKPSIDARASSATRSKAVENAAVSSSVRAVSLCATEPEEVISCPTSSLQNHSPQPSCNPDEPQPPNHPENIAAFSRLGPEKHQPTTSSAAPHPDSKTRTPTTRQDPWEAFKVPFMTKSATIITVQQVPKTPPIVLLVESTLNTTKIGRAAVEPMAFVEDSDLGVSRMIPITPCIKGDPHAPEMHACCREPSRVIASCTETTSISRGLLGDDTAIPDTSIPHVFVPQDPGDFNESSQSLLSRLYQPSHSSLIPLSSPPSLDFSPSTLLLLLLPPPPLEAPSLKLEDDILLSKAKACEMRSRRV